MSVSAKCKLVCLRKKRRTMIKILGDLKIDKPYHARLQVEVPEEYLEVCGLIVPLGKSLNFFPESYIPLGVYDAEVTLLSPAEISGDHAYRSLGYLMLTAIGRNLSAVLHVGDVPKEFVSKKRVLVHFPRIDLKVIASVFGDKRRLYIREGHAVFLKLYDLYGDVSHSYTVEFVLHSNPLAHLEDLNRSYEEYMFFASFRKKLRRFFDDKLMKVIDDISVTIGIPASLLNTYAQLIALVMMYQDDVKMIKKTERTLVQILWHAVVHAGYIIKHTELRKIIRKHYPDIPRGRHRSLPIGFRTPDVAKVLHSAMYLLRKYGIPVPGEEEIFDLIARHNIKDFKEALALLVLMIKKKYPVLVPRVYDALSVLVSKPTIYSRFPRVKELL